MKTLNYIKEQKAQDIIYNKLINGMYNSTKKSVDKELIYSLKKMTKNTGEVTYTNKKELTNLFKVVKENITQLERTEAQSLVNKLTSDIQKEKDRQEKLLSIKIKEPAVDLSFKDYIKINTEELNNNINTAIKRTLINRKKRTEAEDMLLKKVDKEFQTAANKAQTLATTQSAEQAMNTIMEAFKQADLKEFEWVAEPDGCKHCRAFDGKTFKIGAQVPPLHPRCRCTARPKRKVDKLNGSQNFRT